MKAYVSSGTGLNYRSVDVEIPARTEMTPQAAVAFAQVAFGNAVGPYRVAGGGKVYRVRLGKVHKIG